MMNVTEEQLFGAAFEYVTALLRATLKECDYNKSLASKKAGISGSHFGRLLDGQRGQYITLQLFMRVVANLGGNMATLFELLGMETFARLARSEIVDEEMLLDILTLSEQNPDAVEAVKKLVKASLKQ